MFSAASGPFQRQHPYSAAQTPFQRLKPACVELLSLAGRSTGAVQTQQMVVCLRRLQTTLRALITNQDAHTSRNSEATASSSKLLSADTQPVLSPALINYVFYPLSELIRSAPKGITSLPDSICEATLEVLQLLCSQWWAAWIGETEGPALGKGWQVWCDLVILASSVLGAPSSKDKADTGARPGTSDEVKIAALKVLTELLSPRFRAQQVTAPDAKTGKANEDEWEWDGVSDLPDLDDQEPTAEIRSASGSKRTAGSSSRGESVLAYPTPSHLSYASTERVAKGAISFVLSSCFDIAQSSQECLDARSAAVSVAHSALLTWIGGACQVPLAESEVNSAEVLPLHFVDIPRAISTNSKPDDASPRTKAAERLRPLLPGITSTLTRLATSRIKSTPGSTKQKPTPSPIAAKAIELLGDLFRVTLSNEVLRDAIAHRGPLERTTPETSTRVTNLEDFAALDSDEDSASESAKVSSGENVDNNFATKDSTAESSAANDAKWVLSTLAQVNLALKTFAPLTQPSLPGTLLPSSVHPSVQKAILRLALVLLLECGGSFAWLDEQLEGMARLDATSGDKDGTAAAEGTGSSSVHLLLAWIVDLASEYNSASVSESARASLEALRRRAAECEGSNGSSTLEQIANGTLLWHVMKQALDSLPAVITAHNDASVSRLALRASTALDLLLRQVAKHNTKADGRSRPTTGLAKLAHDMQDTFSRLVRPLKIDRLDHVEEAAELGMTTWRLQPVFSGLEASTSTQLSRMFFTIGRSLALSLVNEIRANRNSTGAKADLSEILSLVTFLIDRAAGLRSMRVESGTTDSSALMQDSQRRDESLTSLVLAADVLRGVSSCLDNLELGMQFADLGSGAMQASKQARKVAHKLGKKIFSQIMNVLDSDAEEAVRASSSLEGRKPADAATVRSAVDAGTEPGRDLGPAEDGSSEPTLVERVKGISLASDDIEASTPERHGPALDLGFVRAANLSKASGGPQSQVQLQLAVQHRYQQAQRKIDLSNALVFALLGSTSKLLGQSFRPLLLRGSYPLISGMSASASASSELVRQASASAMKDIAFYTAYADVKNCLLDQADYILGSACQRLISGLDEELRAIALADSSATPNASGRSSAAGSRKRIANDGAERATVLLPLVSAQQAPFVLVEMIRVLGSEIIPMVEDAIDEILDALDRFHEHHTICDGLLAVLDSILETMAVEQASKPSAPKKIDQIAAVAHEIQRDEVESFETWLAARKGEPKAFDEPDEADQESKHDREEKEDKPSKSQQVASQILTKAIMFLTHPSPVLRSRVLGLLRHGIETLAPQQRTAELLPIVNTAWPYVMTRLGPAYSNVKASRSTQLTPIIDLDPSAIGARARSRDDAWFGKLEASFVERDPQVWVAAARFVEAAAEHVSEFVGKRVVEEAWPRFEQLLTLMRWKFDPRMAGRGIAQPSFADPAGRVTGDVTTETKALLESESEASTDKPVTDLIHASSATSRSNFATSQRHASAAPHAHFDPPFILPSASSVPAQLTLCILTTLTAVVRHVGARMPDDAAWSITTQPFLLDLLDARQPPSILRAAEALYIELGKRNPEATRWAVETAFPAAASAASVLQSATPCFMHHAVSKVRAETVHHIVSSFTAM